MNRHPLLTQDELADLAEIDRLLHEANAHALKVDGYCKSGEGYLEVNFGTHWDRDPTEPRKVPGVNIYAYMIGPHRDHNFDTIEQALEVVKVWHHNAMLMRSWDDEEAEEPAVTPGGDLKGFSLGVARTDGYLPDPYVELEARREREMEEFFRHMDDLYEEDA